MMKAITVTKLKEHAQLIVRSDICIPKPDVGEVLIRVYAAGVNRADLMQLDGTYPMTNEMPRDILGLEVSGVIEDIGPDTDSKWLGRSVCALIIGRGYAEYVCAPIIQCMPIPDGCDMVAAAGIPETFLTVWANICVNGIIDESRRVLIDGASSGIGTTAIQIARYYGVEQITAITSTAEKERICKTLGANDVILRDGDNLWGDSRLGEEQYDLAVDVVGAPYFQGLIRCLARGGRLVFISLIGGTAAKVDLMPVLTKHLTITGSTLRSRSVEEKASLCRTMVENLWPGFEDGSLRVQVDSIYTFNEVNTAHDKMRSNQHTGKILLKPN